MTKIPFVVYRTDIPDGLGSFQLVRWGVCEDGNLSSQAWRANEVAAQNTSNYTFVTNLGDEGMTRSYWFDPATGGVGYTGSGLVPNLPFDGVRQAINFGVQLHSQDTTANLLLRCFATEGSFGLGSAQAPLITDFTADAPPTGFYRYAESTVVGGPEAGTGTGVVYVHHGNGNNATFHATRLTTGTNFKSWIGFRSAATGAVTWVERSVFSDANFTLQDDGDATKRAQFQLSGITTGTTRTFTLPNTSSTLAILAAQTFSGLQTFAAGLQVTGNSTVRIGNNTANDLILRGNTVPVISVGGSTNAAVITTAGTSAGSGHVGIEIPANDSSDGFYITTDANFDGVPDTLALRIMANGVTTAQRVRDDGWFIVDSADITKQVQFDASLISAATTRTIQIPDVGGIMVVTATGRIETVDLVNLSVTTAKVADNAIGNNKMAQMPAGTIKANVTSVTANADDVPLPLALAALEGYTETATSGGTLALTASSNRLQAFTGTANHIVSLPTAATVVPGFGYIIYNRSTGTITVNAATGVTLISIAPGEVWWMNTIAATGGGVGVWQAFRISGVVPGGSNGQVQFNGSGAFAGAAEVAIENGQLRVAETTAFTAPADNGVRPIAIERDGKTSQLAMLAQDGIPHPVMFDISQENIKLLQAINGANTLTAIGVAAPTAIGTATAFTSTDTSTYTRTDTIEYLVTTAAATAIAGFRTLNGRLTVGGSAAGRGGLFFFGRWGPATGVATATMRAFFGLRALTSAPTDVEPSQLVSCVFMGWDAADANVQIMHNDASGLCTKVDLGASFPVPTADRTDSYDLFLYSPPGTTQTIFWRVVNRATGAVASGQITANMPTATTRLSPTGWCSVGGTSSVVGFGLSAAQWKQAAFD